jgi:putative polyketide hydroxylase
MGAYVADRFRDGPVFLAGDAAHVIPPIGGFGGNTGVQDAHNLAWKLAFVLRGQAGEGLLDTYEAERLPLADFTVEQALLRMHHRGRGSAPAEMLHDLAVIFGYRYHSAAVIGAEQGPPALDPRSLHGQPGTRAPHAWLERDGQRISTLDLFGRELVLLAEHQGTAWREAAALARAHGAALAVYQLGQDVSDCEGALAEAYRIGPTGALLVRPDGFVAWRADQSEPDTAATLAAVVRQVLAR